MAINAAHWSIDRQTRVIDYIGDDHGGAAPSYATMIEFHRWIGDLAGAATSSGDDELDITDSLPSTRATDNFITLINGYSVTAAALEHLYDGSLVWDGGNEIADGIVNFGNVGVMIQILQNGSLLTDDFWNFSVGGTCTAGSSGQTLEDSGETWTTDQWVGYIVENTSDGSQGLVTSNTADTITVNQLRGGTENDFDNAENYLISKGLNSNAAAGISHRFLIKTRTAGVDIDGRVLYGLNRTYNRTFGAFKINGTARGNNVLALSDAGDLNNTTAHATADALVDIHIDRTDSTANASGTNAAGQNVLNVGAAEGTNFAVGDFIMASADNHEYKIASIATDALTLNRNLVNAISSSNDIFILNIGFSQIDVNNDTTNEDYYAQWDRGANSINTFYEFGKYLSADYTDHYIYGIPGGTFRGITHELTADARTGTFHQVEPVSWTAGDAGAVGTGQMLAIDSPTAGTKMWIQLLTGGAPGDNSVVTGTDSTATFTLSAVPTDRSSLITSPFVGASTGSALIGGYGLSLQTTDLGPNDKVFDLTNTQITPPNNVQFDVGGLDITGGEEDYVAVYRYFGDTDINGDPLGGMYRWKLNAALTTDNITTVQLSESIPTTVPATGYIQIIDDNGVTRKLAYTSYATDTFSGISPASGTTDDDFATVNATPTAASYKGDVLQGEFMLDTALTTDNITSVVVDGTIPTDTPTTNYPLRVQDDNGFMRLLNYTARTGSTFTVDTTNGQEDFNTVNASLGSIVYIGYLDQVAATATESFNYIYGSTDKNFVIKVRNGGTSPIKEYIATGTMGTNGGSSNAIRTTDE